MEDIVIRPACKEDCQQLCDLIQDLADFEQTPKDEDREMKADDLERDGFGEHPLFQCVVAESNGKLIGFASFYFIYSTLRGKSMYLEKIHVTENYRKKGVGSLLFDAVAKKAAEADCYRLDFSVLSWNPAIHFYKKKGAVNLTEKEKRHCYRLDYNTLKSFVEKDEA